MFSSDVFSCLSSHSSSDCFFTNPSLGAAALQHHHLPEQNKENLCCNTISCFNCVSVILLPMQPEAFSTVGTHLLAGLQFGLYTCQLNIKNENNSLICESSMVLAAKLTETGVTVSLMMLSAKVGSWELVSLLLNSHHVKVLSILCHCQLCQLPSDVSLAVIVTGRQMKRTINLSHWKHVKMQIHNSNRDVNDYSLSKG